MKLKNMIACVMFMVAAISHSIAGSDPSTYSSFDQSLVLVESSDGEGGVRSIFKGKLPLTGKLIIEFDRAPDMQSNDSSIYIDREGEAFFLPDERSRMKLPRAIGRFYPSPVTTIELRKKPSEFLSNVVGSEKADSIFNGDKPRYEIPARLTIRNFGSWVECDHRIYTAEIDSIERYTDGLVAMDKGELLGC